MLISKSTANLGIGFAREGKKFCSSMQTCREI